jgi:proteasome lid subunit RPN8/RPN11
VLILTNEQRAAIEAHAESGYPLEICGFLVGRVEGDRRIVASHRPVENAWDSSPSLRRAILTDRTDGGPTADDWEAASEERRFLIDPRDFATVDREAQQAGLGIIGFYHSHPNHPAEPSRFDRDLAMPEQSYLIVSVREGNAVEFRSWVVLDFDAPYVEEEIVGGEA